MSRDAPRHEISADRVRAAALPPLILVGTLAVGFLLGLAWPLAFSPALQRPYSVALGIALMLFAFTLAFAAVREFNAFGTPVDIRRPVTELVTSGPFRHSRNPIYLGMVLLSAGIAFAADSVWILIVTAALALILKKGVIEAEETYLERKFGTSYLDYKSRVRRWI
jgi:protein-S-isoprenylcysteine O-methyltransferase Ste14